MSEQTNDKIVYLLKRLFDRLELLEGRVRKLELGSPGQPAKRKRHNWEDYQKVRALTDQGCPMNRAANLLGLSYSTVRYYAMMDPAGPEAETLQSRELRGY